MGGIMHTIAVFLLIAELALAQGNVHLRGDSILNNVDTISEKRRVLSDESSLMPAAIDPSVAPTSTPVPVSSCYSPYYYDGSSCQLCDNGIISFINPDSDIQQCEICASPKYIKDGQCINECKCTAEGDWADTYCGYYAFKVCSEGTMGTSRRFCKNGVWDDEDDSACLSTSDIKEGSGMGMISIPITFKDYPPFVDNKEITLYVTKATLNQYPFQLDNLLVTMENTYDGVNKDQIAHISMSSNSIFTEKISASISQSINDITDKLNSMNDNIFSNEVLSNVEVNTDSVFNKTEVGMCPYTNPKGRVQNVAVGLTIDIGAVGVSCGTYNFVPYSFQCTQSVLTISPYLLYYRPCVYPVEWLHGFDISGVTSIGIDFVGSNFYENYYRLLMKSIKYPKKLLTIKYVSSMTTWSNVDQKDVILSDIVIIVDPYYTGDRTEFANEILSIMESESFKTEFQSICGTEFIRYKVKHNYT